MKKEFIFPDLNRILDSYNKYGFVIIRNVLGRGLLEEINNHIDWLIKKNPGIETEKIGHWLISNDPFWIKFLSDVNLLHVAEAFIGPDIALFAADYICKKPLQGKGVIWHQDGNYWPLDPMNVITIWFAVTKSNSENGCVRMIPGSHNKGLHRHSDKEIENHILNPIDSDFINEKNAYDIELYPGDISVHHPLLIHGSNPNKSNNWRKGGSIQYIPTSTMITEDWPCAFLFKGNAIKGINSYKKIPKFNDKLNIPIS